MKKRKIRQLTAFVMVFVMLIMNCGNVAVANSGEVIAGNVSSGETPLIPIGGASGESDVMPLDIQYGTVEFKALTKAVTPAYAPYGTGCALMNVTLAAGKGVYLFSRDYDCYYVCWYDSNGKEVYGYIPLDALDLDGWGWTQYDVYRKGVCTGTTQVLSGPGTINTYVHVDYINASTPNLTVLAKKTNAFNNKLYYFVQWETSAGLAKRGWVDSTLGTVTYFTDHSASIIDGYDSYMMSFKFIDSNLALTFDPVTYKATFEPFTGNNFNQMFYVQKTYTDNVHLGFYRIMPALNTARSLAVSGYGYLEGAALTFAPRAEGDKRQEFKISNLVFDFDDDGNFEETFDSLCYECILSRSTGENRFLSAVSGTPSAGMEVVQTDSTTGAWQLLRIDKAWGGGYIKETNLSEKYYTCPKYILPYKFPANYKVYLDSSIESDFLSLSELQACLDRWNNAYTELSLTAVSLAPGQSAPDTDRLATIAEGIFENDNVMGETCGQRFENGVLMTDDYDKDFSQDSNINSNFIYVNQSTLEDMTKAIVMKVISHEIGHALKMTHTYQGIVYDGVREWDHVTQHSTLMDQGTHKVGSPTALDLYRFELKWGYVESW